MLEEIISILFSTLRVSIPLIFAAMGGFFSERSGIINIALESKMLVGAFFGALCAYHFHSPYVGFLGAAAAGAMAGLVYATAVISLKADQIVSGVAMNLFAAGLTPLLCNYFFGATGSSASLDVESRFQTAPVFLAFVTALLIILWSRYSASGLWHRLAGEEPIALTAAGISVTKLRWISLLLSGALAGMGGASLSIFLSSSFSRNMSAGRGFIALASLILGKWKPLPTLFACLFFAFTEALQIRLQGFTLPSGSTLPTQILFAIPYLVTLVILAGWVGSSKAPSALGKNL
jgi:simple sugar transport system permease protein